MKAGTSASLQQEVSRINCRCDARLTPAPPAKTPNLPVPASSLDASTPLGFSQNPSRPSGAPFSSDHPAILREFADHDAKEVDVLHEYVRWLSAREVLVPKILFTYRVWGSTRMGDRLVDVDATPLEKHPGNHSPIYRDCLRSVLFRPLHRGQGTL